jgi:hypothetical protein
MSQTLYNGIRLPEVWPPRDGRDTIGHPPPYLSAIPGVIPIDVGRQLFVDEFLIEQTDLARTFHNPTKYEGNPILKPEAPAELVGGHSNADHRVASAACPFDDAVFFDPRDGLFKLWGMAGHAHATAMYTSRDGLHWDRPDLGLVPGSNIVLPYDEDFVRDSFSQWLDEDAADPQQRFKALLFTRSKSRGRGAYLYTSPDGIHWQHLAKVKDRNIGDNALIFYNPFRRKWVLSGRHGGYRTRDYYESSTFAGLADCDESDVVFWAAADGQDAPELGWVSHQPRQLYTLEAVAYESLMLGMFTIHYGPENPQCVEGGHPKLTQLKIAFSRDGFHWDRRHRDVFIAATLRDGDWDRAYIRGVGGLCTVVGDRLYFYYSGTSGYGHHGERSIYAGGSTHVAFLRRDGFASMDGRGELLTRPLTFSGGHLFVNVVGDVAAEVCDGSGRAIEPFTFAHCTAARGDCTKLPITWHGGDLSRFAGQPIRLRFRVDGSLYAFWVSPSPAGESRGYLAAGGPGYRGFTDTANG